MMHDSLDTRRRLRQRMEVKLLLMMLFARCDYGIGFATRCWRGWGRI